MHAYLLQAVYLSEDLDVDYAIVSSIYCTLDCEIPDQQGVKEVHQVGSTGTATVQGIRLWGLSDSTTLL